MKTLIITLCCLFISFQVIAQTSAPDTINWRANYKLKGEDFKGKPDSNSVNAALTSTTISYKIIKKDSFIDVIVYCCFNKLWSWCKYKSEKSILKHEQGHFDISELFARKFRMEVRKGKFKDNSNAIVLYSKIMAEKKLFNSQYDNETDYSNNIKKQLYWNNKIILEINKLNAYKK
jgi:hypothetical protein